MEIFHMTDIIRLIGIYPPAQGRSSFYVQCPCCDDSPHKKHLNINLKKEVFRCPRCGVSGGIFDLYSLYTGIPRNKVRKELIKKTSSSDVFANPKQKTVISPVKECTVTDIESRHATYTALLSKLSLANDHIENLLSRGLKFDDITRLGYKTTPVVGMSAIARQLRSEGYSLAGIPGFYHNDENEWTFIHESRGILIPVRDIHGKIQGLQIRRDNVSRRKFRWVSSAERQNGCGAEGWTHLVGPVRKLIILTEGPMKADVINALTGATVLAVPGVNSLTHLKLTLEELRKLGLEEIKTAFDMDMLTNFHVKGAYDNLMSLLSEMNFKFGTYIWDPSYKGLDDYIFAQLSKKK